MKKNPNTFSKNKQLLILILLTIGLNVNTLFNDYAVDDVVVFTENSLVKSGIKGIPEIFTSDLLKGFNKTGDGLSQARYRPFALAVFAVEYQLFGVNPVVSHLINVLFFTILIILLFKLLRELFLKNGVEDLAFITCVLFVIHPIHTEVIANVKSRDEIITFILLISALSLVLKYFEKNKVGYLFFSLFCFFLALLTRESSVTFIAVVPLVLYFFCNHPIRKAILFSIPFLFAFVGYMILRFNIVGINNYSATDVLNSPFLNASGGQAFATKVFILFKYIWLLFFPYPLSSDYGFNQIPYIELDSFNFIISAIIILSLVAYSLFAFKKKSIISFCALYFFVTISLVTNFVVDVGTPLSERFLFQPSLAFCIVIAILFLVSEKRNKKITYGIFAIILVLFSAKTVIRNSEWKNDESLYLTDVISAPNSARTNLYASQRYILKAKVETNRTIKQEYLKKAINFGERSIEIYPNYPISYLNLGVAYFGALDYFKTAELWMKAYNLNPSNEEIKGSVEMLSEIFFNEGNKFFKQKQIENSVRCYLMSVELNRGNVEAWYNLGGIYFLYKDDAKGIEAWKNVYMLSPNHQFNKEQFYLD